MINAIKKIGEYAIKKEGRNVNDPLEILIDDPESNPQKPSYKNNEFLRAIQIAPDSSQATYARSMLSRIH